MGARVSDTSKMRVVFLLGLGVRLIRCSGNDR